tara:strand:- start:16776 stop:17120 length:345 start_codon:yes stop_codon:yes gene_type:complete
MRTFEEWLKDENLDEGLMKNLALGAALAGGAMGITGCGDSSCKAPQSVDYDSVRGDSLGKPFGKIYRQRREKLQQKAQQLRDAGRTSGTFRQDKLVPQPDHIKSTTSDSAGKFL